MERQNRLLTALAVVLLAIIAAIAIDNNTNDGKKKNDDPDAPATHELVDFKPEEIVSIKIADGAGPEVAFEKTAGNWAMVSPKSVPIEERRVSELVDRFDPVLVEVHVLAGDKVGYGLDPASRSKITFSTADARSWTVYVGKETTVGYGTYVQSAEDGPVGVAQTHLADLAHRGLDDFRSKALWSFSTGTARRIQIDQGEARVVLRKDDRGWWLGDEGPRVDEKTVEDWLRKADLLRAESFVDDGPTELKPTATLAIEDADGTHTLQIGGSDGFEDSAEPALVVVKGEGPTARVGGGITDLVKLTGWPGTTLMTVRKFQVDGIGIALGDAKVAFTKADGAWQDGDGKPTALADGVLEQILRTLADRSSVPVAASSGWGSITLTEANGGAPHQELITVGDLVDGAAVPTRAAKDAAGGPAFAITQAGLDVLIGVSKGTTPPPTPAAAPSGPAGFEGLSGFEGFEGFPEMGAPG